jgi:hypothetical protein
MAADVRKVRDQRPEIPVGIIQDGAPEMWNLTRTALQSAGIKPSHEAVDRYHFNERKAAILRIVEEDAALRTKEMKRWNDAFDDDETAIDEFAQWLAIKMEQGKDSGSYTAKDLAVLEDNWTFISNNNDRLRYASIRKAGLPQGSGATEGSCKSLVSMRAKRSGQRWHTEGLDAILTLRSIKMSGRLSTFWPRFADEYTAELRVAA